MDETRDDFVVGDRRRYEEHTRQSAGPAVGFQAIRNEVEQAAALSRGRDIGGDHNVPGVDHRHAPPRHPAPVGPLWQSSSCKGEKCRLCGEPAAAKVGEEIMWDDPAPNRHSAGVLSPALAGVQRHRRM